MCVLSGYVGRAFDEVESGEVFTHTPTREFPRRWPDGSRTVCADGIWSWSSAKPN